MAQLCYGVSGFGHKFVKVWLSRVVEPFGTGFPSCSTLPTGLAVSQICSGPSKLFSRDSPLGVLTGRKNKDAILVLNVPFPYQE